MTISKKNLEYILTKFYRKKLIYDLIINNLNAKYIVTSNAP